MLTDTSRSPKAIMTPVGAGASRMVGDGPLAVLRRRTMETTIPSMGAIMFDSSVAHAVENFRVAAGLSEGVHDGPPFMDGDLYKWLEAAVVARSETTDPELAGVLDDQLQTAAEVISAAQQSDGYLFTKAQIAMQTDLDARPLAHRMDFETYNLGHLITMACVHHRLLGGRQYLDIALRAANYLIETAAEQPELLADCNICPSHYMGVVELYRVTGDANFRVLAEKLLELHGGKGRDGSDDNQDVLMVRDQRKAVGHSVRANYLYAGMADVALETGDQELVTALRAIWDDLQAAKVYLTGGCGALYDGASPDAGQDYSMITRIHQAYGRPYQLPQTTAYNESCASLGLIMWAWRMLLLTGESRFADEIERTFYNAVPAMIGADGISYFYTNPLRQVRGLPFPLRRAGNPADSELPPSDDRHRQEYMTACFCCPPNIARFIAELPYYTITTGENTLWIHQFLSGRSSAEVSGVAVRIDQQTSYPADGTVRIGIESDAPVEFTLMIRVPGWADPDSVTVDGAPARPDERGYLVITRRWQHDTVEVEIPIRPRLVVAHRFVEEATGQVAVQRGPVVYCLETADLPADTLVDQVEIPADIAWSEQPGEGIFTGHVLLEGSALVRPVEVADGRLYAELDHREAAATRVRLVPYALWGNRGRGEMSVWLTVRR